MPTSNRLFSALVLVLASSSAACSTFGSDSATNDSVPTPARDDDAGGGGGDGSDTPKAKAVDGTPDTSDINETLGVFVAPSGNASNQGTRERPLAGLQAGIDLGKKLGKRVYVCTGTYSEAITLADSISVIGGLDCSAPVWKLGAAKSRVEAPSSPAVAAMDIASATRLEGLEIVAPGAATPSASSIGLLAVRSPALTIAGTAITAGNGANGDAGDQGVQLTAGSLNGSQAQAPYQCYSSYSSGGVFHAATCFLGIGGFTKPARGAAGPASVCLGAPGHDGGAAGAGGAGGSGGVWEAVPAGGFAAYWRFENSNSSNSFEPGQVRSGAPGTDAPAAPQAPVMGTLSPDGYAAAEGVNGTDGAPGAGGSGASGSLVGMPNAGGLPDQIWIGAGGGSGGAGGCPGLAGTAGRGGGASIAVALVESPLVLDGATLRAGNGGVAGLGSFGSVPTIGGSSVDINAKDGGRGGFAGISTNGSSGPSLGVLRSGAAPEIKASTKIILGAGGAAIDAQVRTVLGVQQTIPATAAGLSEEVHAL